jgi:hypothetical protein
MTQTRFACLALQATTDVRVDDLEKPADLGAGYHLERPDGGVALDSWKSFVGEHELESIQKCDAWIWAPGSDGRTLRERIGYFETALFLTRAPLTHASWVLDGELVQGRPRVSSFGKQHQTFIKEPAFPLTTGTLKAAASVADTLARTFERKALVGRLERGFISLVMAMRVSYIEESILYLMRALEGMLHADDSKQFQARAAAILKEPGGDLLREVYHVRNKLTHVEPIELVFPNMTPERVTQRALQLQAFLYHFATRAYRKALLSSDILAVLTQGQVGDYWGDVVRGRKPPPINVSVDDSLWNFEHQLGHYLVEPIDPKSGSDQEDCCS